jgi:hypothetical protein
MKKLLSTSVLFFLIIAPVLAQNSSVYSRYGIGDLEYGYSPKLISIGDLGIAQLDQDHLLVSNPAGWTAMAKTRIEFGFGYKGVLVSDANRSVYNSETDFKGFTFGFPVSRDLGIGVVTGLVPYSRVSYKAKVTFASQNEIPAYNVDYEGKGGLSRLFVGSSVYLPLGFSAGASLDYYFGNIDYISTINFQESDDFINTTYENLRRSTGFGGSFGLISPNLASSFSIPFFNDLRVGFSYSLIGNLNTDTLFTSTSLFLVDTISTANTELKIPQRLNGGISFVFNESYNINLDFMYQPMSEYKFNNRSEVNLRDVNKFSAGFEYKPKRTLGMSEWEQIIWRLGLSYEQTQYIFNGNGIDQLAAFAGFSYPLGLDNSIDFAVQYSKRGTTENNLLNENSIRVYLGLSFGELWFLRYDK